MNAQNLYTFNYTYIYMTFKKYLYRIIKQFHIYLQRRITAYRDWNTHFNIYIGHILKMTIFDCMLDISKYFIRTKCTQNIRLPIETLKDSNNPIKEFLHSCAHLGAYIEKSHTTTQPLWHEQLPKESGGMVSVDIIFSALLLLGKTKSAHTQ